MDGMRQRNYLTELEMKRQTCRREVSGIRFGVCVDQDIPQDQRVFNFLSRDQQDELAKVRFFMDLLKFWPDANHVKWGYFLLVLSTVPLGVVTILEVLFIITEAKTAAPFMLLQVITDICATGGIAVMGIYFHQSAKELLKISTILVAGFPPLEAGHAVVKVKERTVTWVPWSMYIILNAASVSITIFGAWQPVETREFSFRAPEFCKRNSLFFYPVLVLWLSAHLSTVILGGTLTCFVIELSNIAMGKSATLRNIIRDLRSATDQRQRDITLDVIIRYHTLLIRVFELAERFMNGPMLTQFVFLMIGMGTPILHIITEEMETSYLIFLCAYMFWPISHSLLYFLLCDTATASAQRIAFSAYLAYQPGMTKDQVRKLCITMCEAQRPLTFTARKFAKLNRRAMLKLMQRSYSLCSAVMRMRHA